MCGAIPPLLIQFIVNIIVIIVKDLDRRTVISIFASLFYLLVSYLFLPFFVSLFGIIKLSFGPFTGFPLLLIGGQELSIILQM
jgi:hypothetical protein